MKKILLVLGHPQKDSFCGVLAKKYLVGLKSTKHEVKTLHLGELKFDPILHNTYAKRQDLEPDLLRAQKFIQWADHLTFVYPIWWSTPPPLLLGFIDRVFLPGFAFSFHKKGSGWDKLLKNKSARLIVTMDAPPLFYKWIFGNANARLMKRGILGFCGIKPTKINYIGSVKMSNERKRQKWLDEIYQYGLTD